LRHALDVVGGFLIGQAMPTLPENVTVSDVDEALRYVSLALKQDSVLAYADALLDLRLLLVPR
jgi:hypothetical protein